MAVVFVSGEIVLGVGAETVLVICVSGSRCRSSTSNSNWSSGFGRGTVGVASVSLL